MEIIIRKMDEQNIQDVNRCNGVFTVDAQLVLHAQNGRISYIVVSIPPYKKQYLLEEVDYRDFINNPEKVVFLAYINDQIAGQIRVLKYWNCYAYIDDVIVDVNHRKQGVGRALIMQAIEWAKENGFPGLMLETQNNNVSACRLYESCGFELGGFDFNLYKGITPGTDEIALYWYFIL
jgi:streptothricin acetyltransferase